MKTISSCVLRWGIVVIAVLIAGLFYLESSQAQPGRNPPGGGGRPPVYTPPQPPGGPQIPRPPNPQPPDPFNPNRHQPPNPFAPPPHPGVPQPHPPHPHPGIPIMEHRWECSNCSGLIGTGPNMPTVASCPHCRASFVNGVGGNNPQQPPHTRRATMERAAQGQQSGDEWNPLVPVLLGIGGVLFLVGVVTVIVLACCRPKAPKPLKDYDLSYTGYRHKNPFRNNW